MKISPSGGEPITRPNGAITQMSYDATGNLLARVTPKAETITFAYDAVNQLLTKTLPGNLMTSDTTPVLGMTPRLLETFRPGQGRW